MSLQLRSLSELLGLRHTSQESRVLHCTSFSRLLAWAILARECNRAIIDVICEIRSRTLALYPSCESPRTRMGGPHAVRRALVTVSAHRHPARHGGSGGRAV